MKKGESEYPDSFKGYNERFGKTPAERLASRSELNPRTGCLIWRGSVNKDGYGSLQLEGKILRTHRVAWILKNGPIPKDRIICHHCDTPACVNTEHMYLGTDQTNSDDKIKRGRINSRKGGLNGRAVVPAADIQEIRNDTRPSRILAEFYGVNRSTIQRIKKGTTWSD